MQLILSFKFFCKNYHKNFVKFTLEKNNLKFLIKTPQKNFGKKGNADKCKLIELHERFMGIIIKPKDHANFPSVMGEHLTQ
jgi:hypothetical protein